MKKSMLVFATLSMLSVAALAADNLDKVVVSGYRKSVSAEYATRKVPQSMKRDVECMVKVLKAEAHVDNVESGDSNSHGWTHHPFVKYRYQEKNGQFGTVWFDTEQSNDSKHTIYFIAILNGLASTDEKLPPDWDAGKIANDWTLQCGVNAEVLYE